MTRRELGSVVGRSFSSITAAAILTRPSAFAIGESSFKAPDAADMKSKVSLDQVIIGVDAYSTPDKTSKAFGKLDPNKYEVLPVLIVIKNNRKTALRVSPLDVQYIVPGLGKVHALRANEIPAAAGGPTAPNLGPKPFPFPTKSKKNPLAAPEIEARSFAAKMIAASETASGFFYFNIRHHGNGKIYINGLSDASTNQEIFYFEIPFAD